MACARATMTRNTIPAMIEHGTKPSFGRKRRPAMVSVQRQGLARAAVPSPSEVSHNWVGVWSQTGGQVQESPKTLVRVTVRRGGRAVAVKYLTSS